MFMFDQEKLEQALAELPVYEYAFIQTSELVFTERVRYICRTQCPMYGKSWACPPAVGTVEACRTRCLAYPRALMLTSVAEVSDITNIEETLSTRAPHEELTRQAAALFLAQGQEIFVLSTEACAICERCAYPDAPCRHPDRMYPCVESHGILATDIAEKHNITFLKGNLVTWFSLIFFRERGKENSK
jgi:predicted metal-binding protein